MDTGVRENSRKQETSEIAKSMFSQVSKRLIFDQNLICIYMPMKHCVPFQLKKSEVKQLYQLFITDFTLFGYSPAEFIDCASSD